VLVVGGGPVGLVAALGLARRGIPVTVVERESDVYRAPRAMGYHWSALYGLDDLGLLEPMLGRGFAADGFKFLIRSTKEMLSFSTSALVGHVAHPFSLTLGQDQFADIVVDHLRAMPHVEILWHTEVDALDQDGDHVVVTTGSGEQISTPWLVAADGASSRIRGLVGLDFQGLTWPHNFIATNVRSDSFSALGLADNNYVIDPDYGSVVARITKDGLWRVTWAEDATLPEEGVLERIHDFLVGFLPDGADYELTDHSRYRMHQRAASSMRVGRVLLAGDAAHATNPTSGFGLVGGLHDSYILTEALAAVMRGEVCDSVLDKYSNDRLTAFWTVSSPMSTESKRLVFHSDDPDRLEIDLQMLRRVARDPALLAAFWSGGSRIESPSVVTGEYLSRGRNTIA
jgi:3-(3-hydroxy-phenyl)propionate hydroxylase/6-hydroxy-3-succinoylpyridine 3-monooxygenase